MADGGHVVAQRPAAGVAGREERGRHAHPVRPEQRHVGDGVGALDVADVIRPHPEVVAFLQDVDEGFLDELPKLAGGREARDAIRAYLDRYGMRCVGEIDITRPRWSERPTTLVPVILDNIKNIEPGAGKRRFEQGRLEAEKKEQDVLERLRAMPDGNGKPKKPSG